MLVSTSVKPRWDRRAGVWAPEGPGYRSEPCCPISHLLSLRISRAGRASLSWVNQSPDVKTSDTENMVNTQVKSRCPLSDWSQASREGSTELPGELRLQKSGLNPAGVPRRRLCPSNQGPPSSTTCSLGRDRKGRANTTPWAPISKAPSCRPG